MIKLTFTLVRLRPGGEGEHEHDVAWFELHSGRPLACDICGQVYSLVDTKPPTVEWSTA